MPPCVVERLAASVVTGCRTCLRASKSIIRRCLVDTLAFGCKHARYSIRRPTHMTTGVCDCGCRFRSACDTFLSCCGLISEGCMLGRRRLPRNVSLAHTHTHTPSALYFARGASHPLHSRATPFPNRWLLEGTGGLVSNLKRQYGVCTTYLPDRVDRHPGVPACREHVKLTGRRD